MTDKALPQFKYHRDPMASGSIIPSQEICACCNQRPGYLYQGNIYAKNKPGHICPWCIADGSAAKKFNAGFIDFDFFDDEYKRIELQDIYRDVISQQTIGFSTFNPVFWWVHCGEPAVYVGRDGDYELQFECSRCGQKQIMEDYD